MRKLLSLVFLALAIPGLAQAAGGSFPLDKAPIDLSNKESLQKGAKLFVNYCQGCHSLQYQRYNRVARDLGLTDEVVTNTLIFTGAKVGDTMKNAMQGALNASGKPEAKQWFGALPPDLSLIARSRGVDYLYTYLRTFYVDESRPLGVNNAVFPLVGMPHVLWELQGVQKAKIEEHKDRDGNVSHVITGFELIKKGKMTPAEYDVAMADLVNFLSYVGEPVQLERQRIGYWVLAFLALCIVVFYKLKKEFWRDVH